jgi:SAM-dependent methyltransferase
MEFITLQQLAGNTDIYLLDQIIKDRYNQNDLILDAGCGNGRNLHWFFLNKIDCFAIDRDEMAIDQPDADILNCRQIVFRLRR